MRRTLFVGVLFFALGLGVAPIGTAGASPVPKYVMDMYAGVSTSARKVGRATIFETDATSWTLNVSISLLPSQRYDFGWTTGSQTVSIGTAPSSSSGKIGATFQVSPTSFAIGTPVHLFGQSESSLSSYAESQPAWQFGTFW